MSVRAIPSGKRGKQVSHSKGSFKRLFMRSVLAVILAMGFIYLVNEMMMFSFDKLGR
jgi:hypothetical protein